MTKTAIYLAILFLAVMLAQAVVFNNLVLFNCAMPFVFLYFILSLPVTMGTNLSTFLGFLLGLCADAFADTYGLNALSCTLLAFMRKPVFHLYVPRDEDLAGQCPGMRSMGTVNYLKYAGTMILIYCVMVFVLEAFGFYNFWRMVARIASSAVYTLAVIYAIDSLSLSRREKKL